MKGLEITDEELWVEEFKKQFDFSRENHKTFAEMIKPIIDSTNTVIFCAKTDLTPMTFSRFKCLVKPNSKSTYLPKLNTYSVDYVDNDKNFTKSDFQPNSDNEFIELMLQHFDTNHHKIVIDTPELASALEDAMIARDFPGMADVDSSMLLFCKHIKKRGNGCRIPVNARMKSLLVTLGFSVKML